MSRYWAVRSRAVSAAFIMAATAFSPVVLARRQRRVFFGSFDRCASASASWA